MYVCMAIKTFVIWFDLWSMSYFQDLAGPAEQNSINYILGK